MEFFASTPYACICAPPDFGACELAVSTPEWSIYALVLFDDSMAWVKRGLASGNSRYGIKEQRAMTSLLAGIASYDHVAVAPYLGHKAYPFEHLHSQLFVYPILCRPDVDRTCISGAAKHFC